MYFSFNLEINKENVNIHVATCSAGRKYKAWIYET
jgi:hypothetical protein